MIIDWIQQLTPEFYIIIGFFFIILLVSIVNLAKVLKVNRRVGTQDFELLEAITKDENDKIFYNITIVNKSFSSNYISVIGIRRLNIRQSLEERNTIVAPRNKYETKIEMSIIEEITIVNEKNYKKVNLFAENEVGLRRELNPKLLNKYLKRRLKGHLKQVKADAKQKRFETGNYKFSERVGLLIKLLFRPIYKLSQKMKFATNRTLKESEVRRLQKAEHDKIKYKLEETIAKTNEIKIREEAFKENKTRETELELLKQEKFFEIEQLKKLAYEAAYEARKTAILEMNPELEVKKYFEENPIDYDDIDEKVISDLKKDLDAQEEASKVNPKQTYLEENTEIEPLDQPSTETIDMVEDEAAKEEKKPSKKESNEILIESKKVSEVKEPVKEEKSELESDDEFPVLEENDPLVVEKSNESPSNTEPIKEISEIIPTLDDESEMTPKKASRKSKKAKTEPKK